MIKRLKVFVLVVSIFFPSLCFAWTERYVDNTLYTGTKPTGTATGSGNADPFWICLEAGSEGADDAYNNYGVMITGGTGTAGESKRITDYDASGGGCELQAFVGTAWSVAPDATTTYEITEGADTNDGTTEGKSTDGTNGAWRTINYAADNLLADYRTNILAGREYDQEVIITPTGDGNIALAGYTSSAGDHGVAVIDAQSTLANNINFDGAADSWRIVDLELKGATGDAVDGNASADDIVYIHIKVTNAGAHGIDSQSSASSSIYDSDITATTNGINVSSQSMSVINCYIHDVAIGINDSKGNITDTIIDTTSSDGVVTDASTTATYKGNIFYNATGDNFRFLSGRYIYNNIFHTATDYNLDMDNENPLITGYNCFYGGTTGTVQNNGGANILYDLTSNDVTTDPDLVDPVTTHDFNLGTSTTIDDEGFPVTVYGASNTTGNTEMGPFPYEEEAAAGGGATGHGWFSN